jgi:uncharacterized coiled-coil protein SlyX
MTDFGDSLTDPRDDALETASDLAALERRVAKLEHKLEHQRIYTIAKLIELKNSSDQLRAQLERIIEQVDRPPWFS